MKKAITPLTYLIMKQHERKSNVEGYAYNSKGECKKKLFLSDKDIVCNPNKTVDLLNTAITNDPKMQTTNAEINKLYTDYKAKGGKSTIEKWLDEDYYKTEEGQGVLEGLKQVGGLLGGLFGNQEAPESSITASTSGGGTKIAGVKPVWAIIIILAVLASLIGLFVVVGRSSAKKKTSALPSVTPTPQSTPDPKPASIPIAEPVIVPSNAIEGT